MHAFKDSTFTKEREEERDRDERGREKRKISGGSRVLGLGYRKSRSDAL